MTNNFAQGRPWRSITTWMADNRRKHPASLVQALLGALAAFVDLFPESDRNMIVDSIISTLRTKYQAEGKA